MLIDPIPYLQADGTWTLTSLTIQLAGIGCCGAPWRDSWTFPREFWTSRSFRVEELLWKYKSYKLFKHGTISGNMMNFATCLFTWHRWLDVLFSWNLPILAWRTRPKGREGRVDHNGEGHGSRNLPTLLMGTQCWRQLFFLRSTACNPPLN